MAEEDDFSHFKDEDDLGIKPIDHSPAATPGSAKPSLLDHNDPIKAQQERERRAEEQRRQKIREKAAGQDVPEHMMEHIMEPDPSLVKKGDFVDILSKSPTLRILRVGAGWDQKSMESAVDLDLSVFLLDKNDQTRMDSDFIFYNQMSGCDGAVRHEGDNRSGAGDGDDEIVEIDLNGVPFTVTKIMFVVSVYDDEELDHLGQVSNIFIRVFNKDDDFEICRFPLPDGAFDSMRAVYMAALVREGPRWYFQPVAEPVGRGGLASIASKYGIIIREVQSTG